MTLSDIVRNLPMRREEMIRAAGYRRAPGAIYATSSTLGLLGLGIALGAGLALLYAPEPGQKLRKRLASRFDQAVTAHLREEAPARESTH